MSDLAELEYLYTSTMPDRAPTRTMTKANTRWKQLLSKNGKSLHARASSSRAHRKVPVTLAKVRVA